MRRGSFKQVATIVPLGLAVACCLALPSCSTLKTPAPNSWACYGTLSGLRLPVASIAFSPDGQIASTHSSLFPSDERPMLMFTVGYLAVWRNDDWRILESSMLVDDLTRHQVRFNSDGKQCLVAVDKGVVVWDLEKSQLSQKPPANIHALSPDGTLLARLESDEKNKYLVVEDLQTGELIAKIFLPDSHLHGLCLSHDHKLVAISDGFTGESYKFIIWNLETGAQQCSFKLPINTWSCDFSQDGKQIATVSYDNIVRVWNTADGSLEKSFDLGEKPILAVAFSPDGQYLAVGYEHETYEQTGGVILFDLITGNQVTERLEESAWGVTAVAFSPDGEFLATGNSDGEIKLWRVPEEE